MANSKWRIANRFFALVLAVVALGIFVRPVVAQTGSATEGEEEIAVEEKIEYVLPYPGILPDHPLYRLKMLRDRVWGFLIRDPLKKSQWCLLMADKRVWASQMLAEKGRFDLAITTASKAEKYLERAVEKAYEAEEMGRSDLDLFKKLANASLKHEEVLQTIALGLPEELQVNFKTILEYPKIVNEKALMLLTKEE